MNWYLFIILFLCWGFGFLFLWRIPLLKNRNHNYFDPSKVSIIIPARNEENNLSRLLQSIKNQTAAPGQTIVVDDHSVDETAAVAKRWGCTLIPSPDLPPGWLGKSWACWQGAQAARGEVLLFMDADIFLARDGFAKILSAFTQNGDILSVQPYHKMKKAYEQLSAFFNIITMAGFNAFTPLGSKLKPAGAFGPCLMCLKEDYLRLNGHLGVRGEILENMALGKAFINKGYRVSCYGGKGSLEFRMYPEGVMSLIQGFGKTFGAGANAAAFISLFMIVCWVFGGVSLTRHLIQAPIADHYADLFFLLILDLMYAGQIYWMLYRIGNFRYSTALFFQIPLLFFVLVFILSILQTYVIRQVRWKGRIIKSTKIE